MALSRTQVLTDNTFVGGLGASPFAFTTGSFTPPSNCILVVHVGTTNGPGAGADNRAGLASVTGGGLTWTKQLNSGGSASDSTYNSGTSYTASAEIWTAPVGTAASMTVTATSTCNNSTVDAARGIIEIEAYTGYNVSSPVGTKTSADIAFNTNGNSAASLTLPANPASSSIVQAGVHSVTFASNGGVDIGAGWTEIYDQGTSVDGYGEMQAQVRTGSTSTAVDWNSTANGQTDWGDWLYAIEIKEAPAAGVASGSSDYYGMRSIQEGMITSANPHLLQYDGFTPFPRVQAQGDAGYYNIEAILPANPRRLAFESYPARGSVPSPVVPYGKTDYYDARLFSQTLRGARPQWQQHDAYAMRFVQQNPPQGAGGPTWFYDWRLQLVARAGKPNPFTFPYDGFQPLGAVTAVAQVYGADSYYQSDVYPKLRFRDQHDAYAPRGLVPTAATPQGWTAFFDIDQVPKLKVHLIPIDQDQTPDLPPFVSPRGWVAYYDQEGRPKNLAALAEHESAEFTFTAAVTTVFGASDYQSAVRVRPFLTQQHETYPALGLVPTAATPQGWWWPFDVARVKPVPTPLQQFDAYQHFFPPTAVNLGPLGWSYYWDRGRKPVLPDRMPFLFEQLYQTPTATTPQGWSHELGRALVRGFPARLQQFDALQRLSFPTPFIGVTFEQFDARIIRPRPFSYAVTDSQPSVVVPPSAYVVFPELFKRPRPFPYVLWPEQRVAVLNTPAGSGGPSHYFDRRLAVFHRPAVDVLTYEYRGLPFVVVNLIIQKPGPAGLLSGVSLSATKDDGNLSGLKDGTGLQGEVEG